MLGSGAQDLAAVLARVGRQVGGSSAAAEALSDRADGPVLRVGDVVVKAHPVDTDETALIARLRTAAHPLLRDIVLPPLLIGDALLIRDAGRLITAWPYGEPVDPDDPDAAPWEHAAELLARLHRVPVVGVDLPAAGGPARVGRALARLHAAGTRVDSSAAAVIRQACAGLPPLAARPHALVHGDFHLGQLVRVPGGGENPWRLVDIDDLGLGEPGWDLARPAALFAAGILEPVAWERFLGAYRRCGGAAVPPDGDVWAVLDLPARAVVVQAAALAVARGDELDELDRALVDACRRITGSPAVS